MKAHILGGEVIVSEVKPIGSVPSPVPGQDELDAYCDLKDGEWIIDNVRKSKYDQSLIKGTIDEQLKKHNESIGRHCDNLLDAGVEYNGKLFESSDSACRFLDVVSRKKTGHPAWSVKDETEAVDLDSAALDGLAAAVYKRILEIVSEKYSRRMRAKKDSLVMSPDEFARKDYTR